MKVFLMRHGEPSYRDSIERGYTGFGMDLAKLTEKGMEHAEKVAEAVRAGEQYKDIELIVASPYTRALQTAAIVSRVTGIKLVVETDLHEWLADTDFKCDSEEWGSASWTEYIEKRGVRDENCRYKWEPFASVRERALAALEKYRGGYNCILAVAHGGIMRAVINEPDTGHDYCEIIETNI